MTADGTPAQPAGGAPPEAPGSGATGPPGVDPASPAAPPVWVAWVALLALVVLVALVRWRLVDVPLERDEGEYAYAGKLWIDGLLPYRHVYNMKLPGIYAAYAALITVFGETAAGIHTGLLVAQLVSTLLVFALGRRLFDTWTGLAAAAVFAVLGLNRGVQGLFANAEHFVLPLALAGLVLLARYFATARSASLWLSALALGCAVLVKQHAALFLAFAGIALLAFELRSERPAWRRTLLFSLVSLLPYLGTAAYFAACGTFGDFWFWTFDYARAYAQQTALEDAAQALRLQLTPFLKLAWAPWLLAAAGLLLLLTRPAPARARPFLLGLTVTSFLATCPGFFFRPHYFVLVLPALALLAAASLRALARLLPQPAGRGLALSLLLAALAQPLVADRAYLFSMSPPEIARATFGLNPFAEAQAAGAFLARETQPDEQIAVFGSEPQVPFYAGRRSPTGFVYTYALMEQHGYALEMQQRWMREVGDARPRFLVVCNNPLSWLAREGSHRLLQRWFEGFQAGYELRATWDTFPDGTTRSYVDASLSQRLPGFAVSLEIWERKP